jgi:hypothetical protein
VSLELFRLSLPPDAADRASIRRQWAALGDGVCLISEREHEAYVVVHDVYSGELVRSASWSPEQAVESLGRFDPSLITPPDEKGGPN